MQTESEFPSESYIIFDTCGKLNDAVLSICSPMLMVLNFVSSQTCVSGYLQLYKIILIIHAMQLAKINLRLMNGCNKYAKFQDQHDALIDFTPPFSSRKLQYVPTYCEIVLELKT